MLNLIQTQFLYILIATFYYGFPPQIIYTYKCECVFVCVCVCVCVSVCMFKINSLTP